MRDRGEVGELVGRVFDQLDAEFPGHTVTDAVLLVEIDDGEERGIEYNATEAIVQSTSRRGTVDRGLMQFALDFLYGPRVDDDDA